MNSSKSIQHVKTQKSKTTEKSQSQKKKQPEYHWPKTTKPINPFSPRNIEPPEVRKKKIMALKPSKKFHDYHTIMWLRRRYNEQVIQRSIYSLLPDNGKPVVPDDESEEDKQKRLLFEWLDTFCKPKDRFKNVHINPKYFFTDKIFEKILKLKEIFLEFDEDGSRKMELDEMVEMFNQNHINANVYELADLFFKGQPFKPEDVKKLGLDFYLFMNFTLQKDQDFREFMRKIKEKYKKEGMNDQGYLPMNFNFLLDYFINKGKERNSIEIIEKAVEEMDKIIGNESNDNISNEDDEKKTNRKDEFDEQLEKINFEEIIEEFSNLFKIGENSGMTNDTTSGAKSKRRGTSFRSSNQTRRGTFNNKNNMNINNEIENTEKEDDNNIMTQMINNQLTRYDINKMNKMNYEKLHDIKLAIEETKKQIDDLNNNKNNGNKNYNQQLLLPLIDMKNRNIKDTQAKTSTSFWPKNNEEKKILKKPKKDYVPPELLAGIIN